MSSPKKSFDAARTDDIVEETGLSKGTLYFHFKSKDDLIIPILGRMFQREFRQLENLTQKGVSATETIWSITDLLAKEILSLLQLIPIVYQFLALAFRNR